jgi:hypothetical protein
VKWNSSEQTLHRQKHGKPLHGRKAQPANLAARLHSSPTYMLQGIDAAVLSSYTASRSQLCCCYCCCCCRSQRNILYHSAELLLLLLLLQQ